MEHKVPPRRSFLYHRVIHFHDFFFWKGMRWDTFWKRWRPKQWAKTSTLKKYLLERSVWINLTANDVFFLVVWRSTWIFQCFFSDRVGFFEMFITKKYRPKKKHMMDKTASRIHEQIFGEDLPERCHGLKISRKVANQGNAPQFAWCKVLRLWQFYGFLMAYVHILMIIHGS